MSVPVPRSESQLVVTVTVRAVGIDFSRAGRQCSMRPARQHSAEIPMVATGDEDQQAAAADRVVTLHKCPLFNRVQLHLFLFLIPRAVPRGQ